MLVAQKIEKGGELRIRDHRPVNSETLSDINITAMRNDKTGEVQEVVSMNQHFTEVLAYTVDSANRVTVFVEENVDKGIINQKKEYVLENSYRDTSYIYDAKPQTLPFDRLGYTGFMLGAGT